MQAAIMERFGDPEVLELREVPTPKPKPGNVLVKVLAAGVNRLEDYLRAGSVVPELRFPHVLGADAAGEIAELGDGVTDFEVGERVVPVPGYPQSDDEQDVTPLATARSFGLHGLHLWGTYAQFVEVPARWVLRDRSGLPPEEVATLPMVLFTAVRAAKVVGRVKPGDRVLVHAGASGTGSLAIQVVRALGAEVATTIRGDAKAEFANALGADVVIDTTHEDFVARLRRWTDGRGVDVVLDNLGGDVLPRSIEALKPQGTVVAYGFVRGTEVTLDIQGFFFAQKNLRGIMFGDVADYEWGIEQVRAGAIKPLLDRALPLGAAADAHRLLHSSEVRGKLVLQPWVA